MEIGFEGVGVEIGQSFVDPPHVPQVDARVTARFPGMMAGKEPS